MQLIIISKMIDYFNSIHFYLVFLGYLTETDDKWENGLLIIFVLYYKKKLYSCTACFDLGVSSATYYYFCHNFLLNGLDFHFISSGFWWMLWNLSEKFLTKKRSIIFRMKSCISPCMFNQKCLSVIAYFL